MRSLTLILTGLVVIMTGCFSDPSGTVLVNYRLGDTSDTCEQYGVFDVRVRLEAPERSPIEETSRCVDGGNQITVREVPEDVYTVTVEGLDTAERAIFEGVETGINVAEDGVAETDLIRLRSVPASLLVQWRFSNGFMCPQNSVEELEIGLYLRGNYVAYDNIPCMDGEYLIDDLESTTYDLRVRAIDVTTGDYSFFFDEDEIQMTAGIETQRLADLGVCDSACVP